MGWILSNLIPKPQRRAARFTALFAGIFIPYTLGPNQPQASLLLSGLASPKTSQVIGSPLTAFRTLRNAIPASRFVNPPGGESTGMKWSEYLVAKISRRSKFSFCARRLSVVKPWLTSSRMRFFAASPIIGPSRVMSTSRCRKESTESVDVILEKLGRIWGFDAKIA